MNDKQRDSQQVLLDKGSKNIKESGAEPRLKLAQAMQYDKKR